jgi:hypothetical protein
MRLLLFTLGALWVVIGSDPPAVPRVSEDASVIDVVPEIDSSLSLDATRDAMADPWEAGLDARSIRDAS